MRRLSGDSIPIGCESTTSLRLYRVSIAAYKYAASNRMFQAAFLTLTHHCTGCRDRALLCRQAYVSNWLVVRMLSQQKLCQTRHPFSRIIGAIILLLAWLWVFVGTIDGPSVRFETKSGINVLHTAKSVDHSPSAQPWPLWIGRFPEKPAAVHASFLLFDFKQNLRRWPNVAGDISRSPPYALAA